MEIFIKTAAVCLISAILASSIKKESPGMALLIAVASGCLALYFVLDVVGSITEFLEDVAASAGVSNAVLSVLVRSLGVAIMAKLASDICKDSGMATASTGAELAGSAAILYIALPIMRTVFQMIKGLI